MPQWKRIRNEEERLNLDMKNAVKLDNDTMLIRLRAITENNIECLFSTLERLNKEWETTKIMGESYLRILT